MHHRNERKQAREAKHFTAYEPTRHSVIEEADAEVAARQPEREPHYLRPVQASLLHEIECRRLAAMFAGDDDSLVAVQNEGGKPDARR